MGFVPVISALVSLIYWARFFYLRNEEKQDDCQTEQKEG